MEHRASASTGCTGNFYDNAAMQFFWATLKTEIQIDRPFNTKEETCLAIFDYIETFHNRWRLHSSIGYRWPIDFKNQTHGKYNLPLHA